MDFEDNNPFGVSDEDMPRPRIRPATSYGSLGSGQQPIIINEAGKSREGSGRGHITYTIRLAPGTTVRRRYSDFESLRKLLRRLFPCTVVPPIPEKHTLGAYAANPAHAHEDASVIEHRQRTLGNFLNRCIAIPAIHDSWVLERFLDPNTSWKEVLQSERVTSLPRSSLQAPPVDPASASPAHGFLPIPSNGASLRPSVSPQPRSRQGSEDPSDEESGAHPETESAAKEYESVIGNGLEKRARKINKHYATLANGYADLGGQFNSFSLDSQGQFEKFAPAVEKFGQAVDQGYISTNRLVEKLGVNFTEPLAKSVQLAVTARQVLRYRRQRELQVHMVGDALAQHEQQLSDLLKAETEAERMNAYLHADDRIANATSGLMDRDHVVDKLGDHDRDHEVSRESLEADSTGDKTSTGDRTGESPSLDANDQEPEAEGDDIDGETESLVPSMSSESQSSIPAKSAGVRRGFKLPKLSHINHAIHGMMDVDPQTTRRNNITRTRERIQQLKAALEVAKVDAEVAKSTVAAEISRYNTAKHEDIRAIVRAFVRCHIEWAEKNLESWTEAKQAIIDS